MAKRKTKITDEKINITIDPELVAEMRAEAQKPEEQRIRERDEFLNQLFEGAIDHLRVMKSEISPDNLSKTTNDPPVTAPVKKPGRFDDLIDLS